MFWIMGSQFQSGMGSQGPAHEEEGATMAQRANRIDEEVEYWVGISGHIGEIRPAAATAVAPVIGDKQADALSIVERCDPVIVTSHLAIAMKEEDTRRARAGRVESA